MLRTNSSQYHMLRSFVSESYWALMSGRVGATCRPSAARCTSGVYRLLVAEKAQRLYPQPLCCARLACRRRIGATLPKWGLYYPIANLGKSRQNGLLVKSGLGARFVSQGTTRIGIILLIDLADTSKHRF